jgi:indolepyruvate ferredoxin oxidoreductase, alpha subunit
LHLLPGAPDLRRDETRRERAWVPSHLGGHRLPSVLDPAIIQHRYDDDGLWPRARVRLRFQCEVGQTGHFRHGDGGFWHNGLASSIGNAVFNKHGGVTLIVDNFYSAATGGQAIPSSRALNPHRKTNNSIVDAVKGVGATWVKQIDRTYDVAKVRDTLREALTTKTEGPKIIVGWS